MWWPYGATAVCCVFVQLLSKTLPSKAENMLNLWPMTQSYMGVRAGP